MIVYVDHRERVTPAMALQHVQDALARATCPHMPRHGRAFPDGECPLPRALDRATQHSALVELLIEAGIFEQAVADACCPCEDTRAMESLLVTQLTDLAAAAVARSCAAMTLDQTHDLPDSWWPTWQSEMHMLLDRLRFVDLPSVMEGVLPEGYLFYALYPEAYYLRVRQALAAPMTDAARDGNSLSPQVRGPVVVVGLRSIGTSLGAIAAMACRDEGLAVQRLSLRPRGEGSEREVRASGALVARLRDLADHAACFIVVDEGPGLSGASLAGVARFLQEVIGVAPGRIIFLCANAWPGPAAPAWVLDCWARTRRWIVDATLPRGPYGMVQRSLGAILGESPPGPSVLADLSGGAWQAYTTLPAHTVTRHPQFERRKYLYSDGRGRLLRAKFIGLGRHGRLKAQRAAHLAARNLVPPVVGYAHGFLVSEEVSAPTLDSDTGDVRTLQRIAAYYGYLGRAVFRDEDELIDDRFSRLARMVAHNTRAWFGPTMERELVALETWRDIVDQSSRGEGDGKPQPYEWLDGSVPLKCDAADHYLDHGPVWPVDPCYDLAGTLAEWRLDPATDGGAAFMRHYIAESGDYQVTERLPFYRAVYAAHVLGQYDLAYHAEAGRGTPEPRYDGARRRYADLLCAALRRQP